MKKIPVFTSILLIAGVLATMAFSRPLVMDNGVVRGVSANLSNGGSLDLRNNGQVTTFIVRQGAAMFPSGATVAAGDHVTILADCFHPQTTNRSANGTTANTSN